MNKKSSSLKSNYKKLIKEAKYRLIGNNYNEVRELNLSAVNGKSYMLNSKIIEGEELYNYYKIISQIVADGAVPGAIGALIDEEVYESLSPVRREQYVYTLGIIFRDLKKEYEKQCKL